MNNFQKIWKDPVGSKLIAAAIIGLISPIIILLWSLIKQISFKASFYSIISVLNYMIEIPLWILLLTLIVLFFLVCALLKKAKLKFAYHPLSKSIEEFPNENDTQAGNRNTSDEDEKDSNKLVIRKAPTVFFHERICDAFPGVEDYKWIEDPYVAIERLSILLQNPVYFDESYGHGTTSDPIWWFRGTAALYIRKFERIDGTHCLIDTDLINIKRIAVVRRGSYYQDFIYIEANLDDPTGLYNNKESIEYYSKEWGYYREEYGLFNNIPISRQEYDDGVAEINGKLVNTEDAELRVRYLTPYNFIITSKFSPYNSKEFCRKSEYYFNGLLREEIEFQNFLDFMVRLPKNRNDD